MLLISEFKKLKVKMSGGYDYPDNILNKNYKIKYINNKLNLILNNLLLLFLVRIIKHQSVLILENMFLLKSLRGVLKNILLSII